MRRREFLMTSTAVAMAAAGRPWAQGAAGPKTDRVAIMTYSFERILKAPGRPESPARVLELFDLPEMFADRYNVHNVEVQHSHFTSTEASYFKDFLARLARTKSRVSNLNLEFGAMSISAADPVQRAQAIDLTKAWIDHAVTLGSPRVMINQGPLRPENKQTAIDTLRIMSDYAKSKKIMVAMEPRGGGAPRGADAPQGPPPPPAYVLLTEVIKGAGAYSNPDVGNFGGDEETQHAGMRAMFPYTDGNCHMKILTPSRYDLAAAVRLTKELGYKGLYSIEFESAGDPYDGVKAVYDVLIATL